MALYINSTGCVMGKFKPSLPRNAVLFSSFFVLSLCSERTLRTGHFALLTRHPARRHLDSYSQRLECALGAVVIVVAPQAVDVHGNAGTLGEALHAVGDHLTAQLTEPFSLETELNDAVRPVGQVDDGAG